MIEWIKVIAQFIIGCIVLGWSADRFIASSSALAKRMGLSPLVIGILLVGFGTSFPELMVSAISSWQGNTGIAIGNAVGSNIANIGLIIGITALVIPISIHSRLLKLEFPLLFIVSLIVGVLLWQTYLSRVDGVILLSMLIGYIIWLFVLTPKENFEGDVLTKEYEAEIPTMSFKVAIIWWFVGLALLFISSELLVNASVTIARYLQINELIIGLTIVAIGTSLPELATCIVSVWRGEHDIAIGNIIGSCLFNLLAVLAMPALIAPGPLQRRLVLIDYPIMLLFILLLWFFSSGFIHKKKIQQIEGFILLLCYAGYLTYLVLIN